jgi:nucleotide-binding universal stress UspA family protein
VTSPAPRQPAIVVGVDGSPSSVQALRWADRQAGLTGAEVHAVVTWHVPAVVGWETALDAVNWAGDARRSLDAALAEALPPDRVDRVHRHVVEGHPARVLVERAADADLLVVGSRGHGGFAGMLLGSVGLHVLAHAACPVLVVHGDRLPSAAPAAAPGGDAATV